MSEEQERQETIKCGIIKYGYCQCGCGGKTQISKESNKSKKWIRGNPKKFIFRHSNHGGKHYAWKGDNVKYRALHQWIENNLGTPSLCSDCGSTTAKKFEWANISGKYRRDLSDWKRLCRSCHRFFDGIFGERHFNSRLTDKDVIKIKKLYHSGNYFQRELGKTFGISRTWVGKIINKKAWRHVA